MKLSIHRSELLEALQKIQTVVEKKNTVQILGNILLSAKSNTLSICGTDLEVGIKVSTVVEIQQEGELTISAKNFFDIVKELPNESLSLRRKENSWVEITSGKIRFNIASLPAEEYPNLPNFEERDYLEARTHALANMIDKTSFAVSQDATRYLMNGVYFEPLENNIMRMVATDGHRLSVVEQEVFKESVPLKKGVIIPKKGLLEIRKLLDDKDGSIGLSFEKGHVFAKLGDTYLFVRLIEGEYPDYKQVIPQNNEFNVSISKESFFSALKRVSLLAHEKSKSIKFVITKDSLIIASNNPDMGDAQEEIPLVSSNSEENLEIGFNAKYLLDCLPVIESEEILFNFKDKLSPGLFQGKDQKNHSYVLMPLRVFF